MTIASDPRSYTRAVEHEATRPHPLPSVRHTGKPMVTMISDALGLTGCELADAIVHADEVQPGDLMLAHGVLAAVDAVEFDASQTAYVCLTVRHAGLNGAGLLKLWRRRHLLVAVRRYQTTEA